MRSFVCAIACLLVDWSVGLIVRRLAGSLVGWLVCWYAPLLVCLFDCLLVCFFCSFARVFVCSFVRLCVGVLVCVCLVRLPVCWFDLLVGWLIGLLIRVLVGW